MWLVSLGLLALGYTGGPMPAWTFLILLGLKSYDAPMWVMIATAVVLLPFNLRPLRRILSRPIMALMRANNMVPKVSQTERTALDAGVVWIEKELFGGKPNFNGFEGTTRTELSLDEKAFLDGPVEELCTMLDEWQIWKDRELPENVWAFMKAKKFFGMIVPRSYGGLEFSNRAHSEVVAKLMSRSIPTTITVMVPNSLGPAELLIHYGTKKQKDYYLPRLASGEDLPCFALTEPLAGSDAGALSSNGVLFRDENKVLKIRLNWNKRWITLAGKSTVIGLAFNLQDPENFLGRGPNLGITCALVPANAKGIDRSQRHDPLSIPFYNCPTTGRDVVVVAEDSIIGGLEGAGQGWKMLMESLAAGRGISLPAQSSGGARFVTALASAHAAVRYQFGTSIGNFEGIKEQLGVMAARTYTVEAMRLLTTAALDHGIKPPVVTAMTKHYATELGRQVVNAAMDVMAGSAISLGPKNRVAFHYFAAPLGITVEGANILTRTLIIFGQGAFRAHPYAYDLVRGLEEDDIVMFDRALWGTLGHAIRNKVRASLLFLTRGRIFYACPKAYRRDYQKLAWASATFAILADAGMMFLGPKLKTKESLTGRFADVLGWMYMGYAVLRRHTEDGSPQADAPLVRLSMDMVFQEIQKGITGILSNWDVPVMGKVMSHIVLPLFKVNAIGSASLSDKLLHRVADSVLAPTETRSRLLQGIYMNHHPEDPLGKYEHAFATHWHAREIEKKIRVAQRRKQLPAEGTIAEVLEQAVKVGLINVQEQATLLVAEEARYQAILVDQFTEEAYHRRSGSEPESLQHAS
jgi:acyl-CoA dehydrogenase